MRDAVFVLASLSLDFATTAVGISRGLAEQGPIASRLGFPLCCVVEATVVLLLYLVLSGLVGRRVAALASAAGPLVAGLTNLAVLAYAALPGPV